MESRPPVSVAVAIAVPGTDVTFVPLGGDGYSAPFGLNLIDSDLAGDVSGGSATFTVTLDARYCASVTLIGMAVAGATTDQDYRINFAANPAGTSLRHGVTGTMLGVAVSTEGTAGFWVPPATVLPPSTVFSVRFINVDGDDFRLSAEILLWNIRVRELSPWPYLMGAQGSGGQVSPGP